MQCKFYISISFCSSSQDISFPLNFEQGDPFSFPGVGLGNTPLSGVNLLVFHTTLGSESPKVNLRSPRGKPGSSFHIGVQNPMGVLINKEDPNFLHSYPINTSQVIPFLRSIITFSGKRLLTPEGVTGEFSLPRGLFLGSVSYVHCRHKINMPWIIILRKLPTSGLRGSVFPTLIASGPTAGFGLNYNTRCILPVCPGHPPSFSSLRSSMAEKRLPEVTGGFVYSGHKTGSGGLRGLGF